MIISPLAGKLPPDVLLVDIPKLITAYYNQIPNANISEQRVVFGTSGHRGCSLFTSFNEYHVLAITQAICEYRAIQGSSGPLFLGIDTHALSVPALSSAMEVLAANGVEVMLAINDEYTPTPAVSLAIIKHNRHLRMRLADGIILTPSHNPPSNGGYKYNFPNGGPADTLGTNWIEVRANYFLKNKMNGVKRVSFSKAIHASSTHHYDFLSTYVNELGSIIDLPAISQAHLHLGVDPLGGAGVHYWPRIAEVYELNLTVINDKVDPTFWFMTLDWDGCIRMDPSSPFAMERVIRMKDQFDISFACDTDHDRHGIVSVSTGLMQANHYLSVSIDYLFKHRPLWKDTVSIGKTVVSTQLIDRIAQRLGRSLYEVPVGFKWFSSGLYDGSLGIAGEESAGASFLRMDGSVWTTDKDGIVPALLSAEIIAKTGFDPGELYAGLADEFHHPVTDRLDVHASPEQKAKLLNFTPEQFKQTELAGKKILKVISKAAGNNAPIGGLKVEIDDGWFAVRPSGTEDIYKIYAESFAGEEQLHLILNEAQIIVDGILHTA